MTIRTATTLIILSVALLMGVGIVMMASTSSVRAAAQMNDPTFYLKRQLVWMAVAVLSAIVAMRLDYRWWRRMAPLVALAAVAGLVLVLIPGIGLNIGGSSRWLQLGPVRVQPSEFAKVAMLVSMAAWMCHVERRVKRLKHGLLIPASGLGVLVVLLYLEPDYGTMIVTAFVGGLIMFVGGTRLAHLSAVGGLGLVAVGLALLQDPLRMGRLMALFFPERYPATAYHLAQSKLAFIKGGAFGVGLGESIQKQFYLPEAHTDFILAIIGEELGLLVTLGVVLAFLALLAGGLWIASRAPDAFGRYLAFGITILIVSQAAINVGVVTGCLPTKGLALPFISYGGSSLVSSVLQIGILLSIARQCVDHPDEATIAIKDRAHQF